MANAYKLQKIFCNTCKQKTNHKTLLQGCKEVNFDDYDDELEDKDRDLSPDIETDWYLLECLGCEEISLKIVDVFTDWDQKIVRYYPPRVRRRIPEWLNKLPDSLQVMLRETYIATSADNRRLALMGSRTTLDILFVEKVGDIGSFTEKLQTLEKQGFISTANTKVLLNTIEAGNAAAHRAYNPDSETLSQILDIIENVLQAIYILPLVGDELNNKIPKRNKQKFGKK